MVKKKTKNKFDKGFLLTWKKAWIIVVSWFLAVILHNVFSIIFKGKEEAFFFIIAVIIIPIYVLVILIYSLVRRIKKSGK